MCIVWSHNNNNLTPIQGLRCKDIYLTIINILILYQNLLLANTENSGIRMLFCKNVWGKNSVDRKLSSRYCWIMTQVWPEKNKVFLCGIKEKVLCFLLFHPAVCSLKFIFVLTQRGVLCFHFKEFSSPLSSSITGLKKRKATSING